MGSRFEGPRFEIFLAKLKNTFLLFRNDVQVPTHPFTHDQNLPNRRDVEILSHGMNH